MNTNQKTQANTPQYLDLHAMSRAFDKARRARKRQLKAQRNQQTPTK